MLIPHASPEGQSILLGKIERCADLHGQVAAGEHLVKLFPVHGTGAASGAFVDNSFSHTGGCGEVVVPSTAGNEHPDQHAQPGGQRNGGPGVFADITVGAGGNFARF